MPRGNMKSPNLFDIVSSVCLVVGVHCRSQAIAASFVCVSFRRCPWLLVAHGCAFCSWSLASRFVASSWPFPVVTRQLLMY
ncbi:hypothetical protein IC582_025867 [Cucumis melo]